MSNCPHCKKALVGYKLTKISAKKNSQQDYLRSGELLETLKVRFPKVGEKALLNSIEDKILWLEANGRAKRNYLAFAINWIKRGIKYGQIFEGTGEMRQYDKMPISEEGRKKLEKLKSLYTVRGFE